MAVSDPIPLKFRPGVVKDMTRRAAELTWYDTNFIRFVEGLPQTIGGWEKSFNTEMFEGTCRSLFGWNDLQGIALMGIGTHLKYYVEEGGSLTDITPVRASSTINNNPIATTNTLSIITVNDTAHGAEAGDFVTLSGSSAVGGIAAASINKEHQILTIVDADHYTVDTGAAATSTVAAGGGAAVVAEYQLTVGLDTTVLGAGWGAGGWGDGGWGEPASVTVQGTQLRVWTQDNWGEDLLINPRGYGIYYYETSSPARAVNLSTLPGASDTPVVADQIIVSADERQAIAFGTNEIGSAVANPLFYRWCDTEDIANWTPGVTSAAGGRGFSSGSMFMVAHKMRQQIAAFTDTALYSVQYLGTSGYGHRLITDKANIVGPKAACVFNDVLYWKSRRGFMKWDGRVQEIPCPLKEFVYRDTNVSQWWKVVAGVNVEYGEIWWWWPGNDDEEISRYVIYKIEDGSWTPGTGLIRTAWLESGVFNFPRAAGTDGYIYDHEFGFDDGSADPPDPINAYAESCIFAIGNGKQAMRIRQLWPDVDFIQSTAATPEITLTLRLQNKMGSEPQENELATTQRTVALPIEEFTDSLDVGKRGRFIALRYESNKLGTGFRVGVPHLDMIPDGRR